MAIDDLLLRSRYMLKAQTDKLIHSNLLVKRLIIAVILYCKEGLIKDFQLKHFQKYFICHRIDLRITPKEKVSTYLSNHFLRFQHLRAYIMITCLCNVYPLTPLFYIVKLGFTGVYNIFLFLFQNIDCGYSLEPPHL